MLRIVTLVAICSVLLHTEIAACQDQIPLRATNIDNCVNKFIAAINHSDSEELRQLFTPRLSSVETAETTTRWLRDILSKKGPVLSVETPRSDGSHVRVRLKSNDGQWDLKLFVTNDFQVDAYIMVPQIETIRVPKRNTTKLRLPFRDEWYVHAGGSKESENYHFRLGAPSFYAIDFFYLDEDSKLFRNKGESAEDFFGFGRDILSAGDGEVVVVIDGVPDNIPSETNSTSASGNTIIIKHAPDEYTVYSHLKRGSTRVKVGNRVAQGDVIAQCGNSGFTTAPHLHFQLTNSLRFSESTGFPAFFSNANVRIEAKPVSRDEYSPRRGDWVANKQE